MIKQNEVEEIKKLIRSGFDLDLISFEFDIPIQQLRQLKKELENLEAREKKGTIIAHNVPDKGKKKSKKTQSEMEQMRQKYRKFYFRSNEDIIKQPKQLSQRDIEVINKVIAVVEEKVEAIKGLSKKERREIAVTIILPELKKVENYDLPIEYAERLNVLINSSELQGINVDISDKADISVKATKRKMACQLAEAINFKQYDVEDIEELKILASKITVGMEREIPTLAVAVKNRIVSKISSIRQKNAIDRIKNDIPESIISVITALTRGKIDIEKACLIIDEESEKRLTGKPKTKFGLTKEQEKKQVLNQIKTVIAERADQYPIQDPKAVVLQIQQLCGGTIGQATAIVVKNLIARKDFETATSICDKYLGNDVGSLSIRNEIRNARIADLVLKGINMNGTVEEETAYFKLIEKTIKDEKVSLEAIALGKSKDGLRNITLANIWVNKIERNISR